MDDNEEIVGETIDAEGRRVVLLARIWHGKILVDHAELRPFLEGLLMAVTAPDIVRRDVHPDRQHFFANHLGPSRWLRVVVSYEQVPARIITAHGYRKDPLRWKPSI